MTKYKYQYSGFEHNFTPAYKVDADEIDAWKRYCLARVILGEPFYYCASGNAKVIAYTPETEFGCTEFEIDVIHGRDSYTETILYNEKEMFELIRDLRPEFEQISGESV